MERSCTICSAGGRISNFANREVYNYTISQNLNNEPSIKNVTIYTYVAGACQLQVVSKYSKQFRTPKAAEQFFFGPKETLIVDDSSVPEGVPKDTRPSGSSRWVGSASTIGDLKDAVLQLKGFKQLEVILDLFRSYALSQGVTVQRDFLKLFLDASLHLRKCNRTNVVYGMAKAVGTLRQNGNDSLLPAKRMLMGLVEHLVNFFTADNLSKVIAPYM